MHASLLERAALLTAEHGGGSLTMICLSQLDTVAHGLSTSVESTIVLDEGMSEKGLWPAINCSTVSHTPSPAFFSGASRQLASLYKKYLGDSHEIALHADLAREFGLPQEDDARATLEYRHKLSALLVQRDGPLFWEESAVLLFAGLRCDLEQVSLAEMPRFATDLLTFFRNERPALLQSLATLANSPRLLDATMRNALDDGIADFMLAFEKSPSRTHV